MGSVTALVASYRSILFTIREADGVSTLVCNDAFPRLWGVKPRGKPGWFSQLA